MNERRHIDFSLPSLGLFGAGQPMGNAEDVNSWVTVTRRSIDELFSSLQQQQQNLQSFTEQSSIEFLQQLDQLFAMVEDTMQILRAIGALHPGKRFGSMARKLLPTLQQKQKSILGNRGFYLALLKAESLVSGEQEKLLVMLFRDLFEKQGLAHVEDASERENIAQHTEALSDAIDELHDKVDSDCSFTLIGPTRLYEMPSVLRAMIPKSTQKKKRQCTLSINHHIDSLFKNVHQRPIRELALKYNNVLVQSVMEQLAKLDEASAALSTDFGSENFAKFVMNNPLNVEQDPQRVAQTLVALSQSIQNRLNDEYNLLREEKQHYLKWLHDHEPQLFKSGSSSVSSLADQSATSSTANPAAEEAAAKTAGKSAKGPPRKAKDPDVVEARARGAGTLTDSVDIVDYEFLVTRIQQRLQGKVPDIRFQEYFAIDTVLDGLSKLCTKLFNVTLEPAKITSGETWSTLDVRKLEVRDVATQSVRGYIYLDLFATRPGKARDTSPGFQHHHVVRTAYGGQLPISVLQFNFEEHLQKQPTMFMPDQLRTFFREFGHAIQNLLISPSLAKYHMLSTVVQKSPEFSRVLGYLLEKFTYDPTFLQSFAKHLYSNNDVPKEVLSMAIANKSALTSCSATLLSRQIAMANADTFLFNKQKPGTLQALESAVKTVAPIPVRVVARDLRNFGGLYYADLFARIYAAHMWHKLSPLRNPSSAGSKLHNVVFGEDGKVRTPQQMLSDLLDGDKPDIKFFIGDVLGTSAPTTKTT